MEKPSIIPLWRGNYSTKRQVGEVRVSPEDYDYLMQWSWGLSPQGYAQRTGVSDKPARLTMNRGKPVLKRPTRTILMHHEVLSRKGTPWTGTRNITCDHINQVKLDNTRGNLRLASQSSNSRNVTERSRRRKNTMYRGVGKVRGAYNVVVSVANGKEYVWGKTDKHPHAQFLCAIQYDLWILDNDPVCPRNFPDLGVPELTKIFKGLEG